MWRLVVIALLAAQVQAEEGEAGSFIVGGQEVRPPGKYAWQGSLEYDPLVGDWYHSCGCIYIGGLSVLTAAHCVDGTNAERLRVLLGAQDIITKLEGQPEYFDVVSYTINPDWSYTPSLGYPNDVAVMELDRVPPEDNIFIQAIDVPPPGRSEDDWVGLDCVISGWGRLYGGIADLPNMLQEADIDVIPQSYCQELWDPTPIGPYHVCLLDTQNNDRGACNGDSGGPVVCRENAADDYELVGVTSWGFAGCNTRYPSVYAKVSHFSEWISNVTTTWTV